MKRFVLVIFVCVVVSGFVVAEEKELLKTDTDRQSYGMGLSIGGDIKKQDIELNLNAFIKGIRDGYGNNKPLMNEQELQETMMEFSKKMRAKRESQNNELGAKNKQDGETFLAENKKKDGVTSLPSGLQYKVITKGAGASPKPADTVRVHYKGTLIDGTEFDSSYKRNEPAEFQVQGVIKGWTEALQLMKEGDKWQLFIPSELAYGERGAGQDIGPNATLIFEVELLEIVK